MKSKDENDDTNSNDGYTSDTETSGSDDDNSYPENNNLDDTNNKSLGMRKYKMIPYLFYKNQIEEAKKSIFRKNNEIMRLGKDLEFFKREYSRLSNNNDNDNDKFSDGASIYRAQELPSIPLHQLRVEYDNHMQSKSKVNDKNYDDEKSKKDSLIQNIMQVQKKQIQKPTIMKIGKDKKKCEIQDPKNMDNSNNSQNDENDNEESKN